MRKVRLRDKMKHTQREREREREKWGEIEALFVMDVTLMYIITK